MLTGVNVYHLQMFPLDMMFYGMLQLVRLADENCGESSKMVERIFYKTT